MTDMTRCKNCINRETCNGYYDIATGRYVDLNDCIRGTRDHGQDKNKSY
jgi:hypothetical protein